MIYITYETIIVFLIRAERMREREEKENKKERGREEKVRKREDKVRERTDVCHFQSILWCIKFVHINIPLQTQNTPRELAS